MKEKHRNYEAIIKNFRERDKEHVRETLRKYELHNDVEIFDDEGNLVCITSRERAGDILRRMAEDGFLGGVLADPRSVRGLDSPTREDGATE